MRRSAWTLLLLVGCGADVAETVPHFNATLSESEFVARYGRPCHTEPFSTGERWFYCMTPERTIAQCTEDCEERAAYAWNGAVTWGP